MSPGKNSAMAEALDLLEEAVHLLRANPGSLFTYYAATGPFVLALVYFWARVTWFTPTDGAVACGALLLALLFGTMRAGQRHFMRGLMARRLGEPVPRFSWRRLPAETAAQLRLQALGVILLPVALAVTVPFGWVCAYYQSALALPADGEDGTAGCRRRAWAEAIRWPGQNHWGLAILAVLWLAMFVNIIVAFYVVPILAARLLGLHTIFAMHGWDYLNSTFLLLVTVLTHLMVDPLVKAFYLLRVFYGRSRRTGDEIRVILAREKLSGRAAAPILVGLALLFLPAGLPRLRAADPAPVVQPAAPAPDLDRALDRALDQPEFSWRLRPLPVPPSRQHTGLVEGFLRGALDTLGEIFRTVRRWVDHAWNWLNDLLPSRHRSDEPVAGSATDGNGVAWMEALQMTAYVLLAGVVVLLVLIVMKVVRQRRLPVLAPASAGTDAAPDLQDENVQASRLPAEGWLELARQKAAAGEWRLALRALFLATLARLAQEHLVTLTRFKTNLDYEHELQRRAHSRTGMVVDFRGRRREFEEVWYGDAPAEAARVTDWLRRMEGGT